MNLKQQVRSFQEIILFDFYYFYRTNIIYIGNKFNLCKFFYSFEREKRNSLIEFQSSQIDDNERPTAIESATTHAIPSSARTDTESITNEAESTNDNSSHQTILPVIVPSFDDSTARLILTSELSITTTVEEEQQQQQQSEEITDSSAPQTEPQTTTTTTNNNEYINPRGIRFTTTATTPATGGPVKGKQTCHICTFLCSQTKSRFL